MEYILFAIGIILWMIVCVCVSVLLGMFVGWVLMRIRKREEKAWSERRESK